MNKVKVHIQIHTPPEQVINAFTEPEMLNAWWGVEKCLIQKQLGGIYTLAWQLSEQGMGYVTTGIISGYEPTRKLVIRDLVYLNPTKPVFGPMCLSIHAREREGLTDVHLCQDGYQKGDDWNWYYKAVQEAWPSVLQRLKSWLEQEHPFK
ncbi:MAG: SRPBCC domain-containing protein [Saprospiraceae bacterium]|nr:SRPBCC domain-containing protein [Saprospiraceae bacterium]